MQKVTFLGPVGATFSHDAYNLLAEIYGGPRAKAENCLPATDNKQILSMITKHGGYGVLAMETRAEAAISDTLDTFIDLMKHWDADSCPTQVIGAVKMELHFALMARPGVSQQEIKKVLAHEKAKGPCAGYLKDKGLEFEAVTSSNGEAARRIAEDPQYASCGALGPKSAAEKYGLQILEAACEDSQAVTTFFFLGPRTHAVSVGKSNRMLIAFEVKHQRGKLARALLSLRKLNLIHIHRKHVGNGSYHFVTEMEVDKGELPIVEKTMSKFSQNVEAYLSFGPFEVLSR